MVTFYEDVEASVDSASEQKLWRFLAALEKPNVLWTDNGRQARELAGRVRSKILAIAPQHACPVCGGLRHPVPDGFTPRCATCELYSALDKDGAA